MWDSHFSSVVVKAFSSKKFMAELNLNHSRYLPSFLSFDETSYNVYSFAPDGVFFKQGSGLLTSRGACDVDQENTREGSASKASCLPPPLLLHDSNRSLKKGPGSMLLQCFRGLEDLQSEKSIAGAKLFKAGKLNRTIFRIENFGSKNVTLGEELP